MLQAQMCSTSFGSHPAAVNPVVKDAMEGIVHDLGNLIQIAVSAMNVLGRSEAVSTDAKLTPVIERARKSLETACDLVRQTMGRARAEGAAANEPDVTDIAACVTEIKTVVESICEHHVDLSIDISSDLPNVRCSRPDLQSAILNLVLNARDATPVGGAVSLIVQSGLVGPAQMGIVVQVSDTGTGMDEPTRAKAAEPFFTTKSPGKGTGLGLSMVKRFAGSVGGSVHIASKPNLGTTIKVNLPAS
jgi:signal transduction histidine kinase